jgi:hypothetical protein
MLQLIFTLVKIDTSPKASYSLLTSAQQIVQCDFPEDSSRRETSNIQHPTLNFQGGQNRAADSACLGRMNSVAPLGLGILGAIKPTAKAVGYCLLPRPGL